MRIVKVSQTSQFICLHSPEGDFPKGIIEVNDAPLCFGGPDGKMATSKTSQVGGFARRQSMFLGETTGANDWRRNIVTFARSF